MNCAARGCRYTADYLDAGARRKRDGDAVAWCYRHARSEDLRYPLTGDALPTDTWVDLDDRQADGRAAKQRRAR